MLFVKIHLVISALLFFLGKGKINKQEQFCNLILASFFPIGGYLFVLILYFTRNKRAKAFKEEQEEKEQLQILFIDRFNRERDTSIVSLTETLLISDIKLKRHQLLDAMKRDTSGHVDAFKMALRDEDVETSHYAASAIDRIKREFDLKLQKLSVEYERSKTDENLSKEYAKVLGEYVQSELLDENEYEHKMILATYLQVLENILEITEDKAIYYKKVIDLLFQMMDLERASTYCKRFIENYKIEEAYIVSLKYFFLIKDRESFTKYFNELLKSPIKLSREGLQVIRFWVEAS